MQIRTLGLIPRLESFYLVDLYAYATKGVPGLEIVGLGGTGRIIKEKLIFLSRIRGLKFPLKRFVLCVDIKEAPKKMGELSYLELPLLLLYWSLAGHLNFHNMDDCISSGQLNVNGTIHLPSLLGPGRNSSFEDYVRQNFNTVKLMKVDGWAFPPRVLHMQLDQLFESIGSFNIAYGN